MNVLLGLIEQSKSMLAQLEEINRKNAAFWERQHEIIQARLDERENENEVKDQSD